MAPRKLQDRSGRMRRVGWPATWMSPESPSPQARQGADVAAAIASHRPPRNARCRLSAMPSRNGGRARIAAPVINKDQPRFDGGVWVAPRSAPSFFFKAPRQFYFGGRAG